MPSFSLTRLFSSLVGEGVRRTAELLEDPSLAAVPTTIRLSPAMRAFFSAQAEAFGGQTMSSIISMTLEGVMRETLRVEADKSTRTLAATAALVADRFAHTFSAHGIDPPTIAELLAPHGITLNTLQDPFALANSLTNKVIDEVTDLFSLKRSWLASGGGQAQVEVGEWYKAPAQPARRLLELAKAGRSPEAILLRRVGANFQEAYERGDEIADEPIALVILQQRSSPSGRAFSTYELWESQRWNYPKCRHYAKVLMRWLATDGRAAGIRFRGIELPAANLQRLFGEGDVLIADVLGAQPHGPIWYPDDYVLSAKESAAAKEVAELPEVIDMYANAKMGSLRP